MVHSYRVSGNETARILEQIVIGIQDNTADEPIQSVTKEWLGTSGGGTRSSVFGNLQGTYTNTTPVGQFDRAKFKVANNSRNIFTLIDPQFISVMVTET